ncbi:MAG: Crp/Fnr family transcriptional regulator [Acidimicrobiaceae bacterium]|nr:Crp/Fnr family transcriptional regulator [Acidimicrobiia bacterium]MCY4492655.1 Crp/Fnr family transcriptional regulator [Acidimicrobiaceae bacterium]
MTEIGILRATELFAGLSEESLATIAATGAPRFLQRSDMLFTEGDEPDYIYIVTSGRVAMVNRSIEGRESVIALMETGDLFGEMPLFDGGKRSTGARALEPSRVIAIPYEPVRRLYAERPEELWDVVKLLVARLRAADESLADSVFLDVTGRTAKRLLELAGESDEFILPVTQEELAGMIGASRERVNKAIASFVRLNWIDQAERRYIITDREQLTLRAR